MLLIYDAQSIICSYQTYEKRPFKFRKSIAPMLVKSRNPKTHQYLLIWIYLLLKHQSHIHLLHQGPPTWPTSASVEGHEQLNIAAVTFWSP